MIRPARVRKAAVLGAGAMGVGIVAHLANAGIPTLLLDLPPTDTARTGIAAVAKGRLPGFAHPSRAALVTPGNFDDDLARLADVDWVIEVVVERLDVKLDLLRRVAEHLGDGAILTTNTSGLSVEAMSRALPPTVRPRFFGTHFFNPPRYMYLLELIPVEATDEVVLASFQAFAEHRLGKGVVRGKDTPNFIANRIGIFSTVYAMKAMERHGITVEDADAASGKALARSGTATFGTSDLAGIDVLAHAVRNHYEGAPQDESRDLMKLPDWVLAMVERGTVGNKAGAGFYKERRAFTIDPVTLAYRPRQEPEQASLAAAAKTADAGGRAAAFVAADDPAGRFAWDLTAATLLYAARRIPEIADDIAAIDRAMRWGFGWELGPFELWDALGVAGTAERMTAEGREVPEWVPAVAASPAGSFYARGPAAGGPAEADAASTAAAWDPAVALAWDPAVALAWDPAVALACDPEAARYRALPARPRALSLAAVQQAGRTLREDTHARLLDLGDGVVCVEFKTKTNTVTEGVLIFIEETLGRAGLDFDALVIANQGALFSAGADLKAMLEKIRGEDWGAIDATLRMAQRVMMGMKYASVPVVAAPFSRVLGGGLELCLHCHRLQAGLETAMGLVEAGAGPVPGAGGMKESLLRSLDGAGGGGAAGGAKAGGPAAMPVLAGPAAVLKKPFDAIMQAKVSASAFEAFDLGYLRPGDGVTMDREGLVYAAKQAALALIETGWQPGAPRRVAVTGRDGGAYLRAQIHNVRESEWISDHDRLLGEKVAWVLSGGDVDAGSVVTEEYLLALERKAFVDMCREPKTVQRIEHLLQTGKPMRN